MKAFRIILRNIRDGFKSVGRNLSLSVASISCITITLLIVSVALIVAINIESITKRVKQDFTIYTFINYDAKAEDVEKIKQEISKIKNVEKVDYQSKVEIAKEMKASSEQLSSIIDTWSDDTNPLYDVIKVKVKDTNLISKTAEKISNIELIEDVKYGKGMVESLMTVFSGVEKAIVVAMILLLFVTLFLIGNTIKITIFSRKREIEIMRLVGASNISIKQPFVIEGLILGFLGAIIPIILTLYGYDALYNHFTGQLFSPFFKLVKSDPMIYYVSLILLVLGVIVGMIGSYKAVRKHLKI